MTAHLRGLLLSLLCCVATTIFAQTESIGIPMRDGSSLSTDLYLPETQEKVPVVLICTPYDKSRSSALDAWRDILLSNGYAVAVQDMRGFYGSADAGKGVPRHYDGYDSVEWLASQAWCNGKVGMMGYSHLGAAQYETAVTDPPHLACAVPAQAPGNYYTDALFPPVFRKADMETILRGTFSARTRQLINRRIRTGQQNDISKFNTPMLHVGGWFDPYVEGAIEMFSACQAQGGANARGAQKLIIGPWGHGVVQEKDPGEPLVLVGGMRFPANAKPDWESDVWIPWFDHWLKDRKNGVMDEPAVQYFLMGASGEAAAPGNRWVHADAFPPPATEVAYFAHPNHTLSTDAPRDAAQPLEYRYDPADPVPTVGRRHPRIPVTGPHDQRPAESREDVLLFTTPVLETPLTIVGRVKVRLFASSDCSDTDFTAMLTDVYPDGRSINFLDSIVRARYRNTYLREELLTPGEVYEFEIDLGHTAIALAPGHRLRLAISSSNFDRFDINPNTGEPYGDHALTRKLLAERLKADPPRGEAEYTAAQVATNKLYLGPDHPMRVILPLVVAPLD